MDRQKIICFGDSITHGQGFAEGNLWTTDLAFRLEKAFPGRHEIYNRGIGGNTTAMGLDRIQAEVMPLLPAVVLIEFGINDAYIYRGNRLPRISLSEYQRNLSEMIRLVREKKGVPVLLVNHPITTRTDLHAQGNGKSIGANLEPYNRAVRRLASTERIATIDLPRLLKKEAIPLDSILTEDGVHLSRGGNLTYSRLVFGELKRILQA